MDKVRQVLLDGESLLGRVHGRMCGRALEGRADGIDPRLRCANGHEQVCGRMQEAFTWRLCAGCRRCLGPRVAVCGESPAGLHRGPLAIGNRGFQDEFLSILFLKKCESFSRCDAYAQGEAGSVTMTRVQLQGKAAIAARFDRCFKAELHAKDPNDIKEFKMFKWMLTSEQQEKVEV